MVAGDMNAASASSHVCAAPALGSWRPTALPSAVRSPQSSSASPDADVSE